MNHLFLFTIGPVQSFISQARKTQDLFAGSQILSDLVRHAAKILKNQVTIDSDENEVLFVFPVESAINSNASIPNRFVAEVKGITIQEIEKIGKEVEKKVRTYFQEIVHRSITTSLMKYTRTLSISKAIFDEILRQTDSLLEIYWTSESFDSNSTYQNTYANIERKLAGIKNIRQFKQLSEPYGRKCSISGERNALFYNFNSKVKSNRFLTSKAIKLTPPDTSNYLIGAGEAIDAVGLIKRIYRRKELLFPSTARIALMNVLEASKYQDAIQDYNDKILEAIGISPECEDQLYFKENLRPKYLAKNFPNAIQHEQQVDEKKLLTIHKEFMNVIGEEETCSYYAIIAFDGDRMGKWLSGEMLKNPESDLRVFHHTISTLLSEFATTAKNYVNDNQRGRTVYAGGDDFLAFLNLKSFFSTLTSLRKMWHKEVSLKLIKSNKFVLKDDSLFSISLGATIAHYKQPLDSVLAYARHMEHQAKEKGKRDAFAIAVLKGSGEIHETVYKWNMQDDEPQIAHDLEVIFKQLQVNKTEQANRKFSTKFIQNLELEFNKLDTNDDEFTYSDEIISSEIRRLIKRSNNQADKGELAEFQNKIIKFYEDNETDNGAIGNFIAGLNIIDFVQRKIHENV